MENKKPVENPKPVDPDEPICEGCGKNHNNCRNGIVSEFCKECERELEKGFNEGMGRE